MAARFQIYVFSLLVIALCSPQLIFAQPTVTLSAEPANKFHSVIFTFEQSDISSMEGCHYNLFAAGKEKDLETLPGKGRSIATFFKPLPVIQIIASPISRASRLFGKKNPKKTKSIKIYFRVLLSCPEAEDGMGEIIFVTLKTSPKGKLRTVPQITRQMKYHMAYYNP